MKTYTFPLIFLLFSCASNFQENTQTTEEIKFHELLGSEGYGKYYKDSDVEILLEATIGDLRIRHVRMKDETCVNQGEEDFKTDPGYRHHIELDGVIGPDSTRALEKLLDNFPNCFPSEDNPHVTKNMFPAVYLNSSGGFVQDGIRMGTLFNENYMSTIIGSGQSCSSSCALAFLGGNVRLMWGDSKILFHAPYTIDEDRYFTCLNPTETEDIKKYFKKMLPEKDAEFFYKRMMDYCSTSEGWTLNKDGAKLLGLTLDIGEWYSREMDGSGRGLYNPDE